MRYALSTLYIYICMLYFWVIIIFIIQELNFKYIYTIYLLHIYHHNSYVHYNISQMVIKQKIKYIQNKGKEIQK